MSAINLGMPRSRDTDWERKAACKTRDPELWFPTDGSIGRFRGKQAKDICNTECKVRDECLTANLEVEHGIFGGLNEKERKKLRG